MAGDASENVFNVIDAFTVPRLAYSVDRKKFLPDAKSASIFAGKYYIFPYLGQLFFCAKKKALRLDQCTGLLVRQI